MTTQTPAASQKVDDIQTYAEISTRLSIHARLDRLVNDPCSAMEDIMKLGRLLSQMIKAFAHNRQLALDEGRLEVRREAQALQRAKLQAAPVTHTTPSPTAKGEPEEPAPLEKARESKPKAEVKKVHQPRPQVTTVANKEDEHPSPSLNQPDAGPNLKTVAEEADVPVPPIAKEHSTAELQAMEWDLRTAYDFGDLRAFEFCTGTWVIRFPDRTAHPEPAKPNYPTGFNPPPDFVQRTDEFVVLPHVLPAEFKPKAEGKSKGEAKPKAPRRERAKPSLKDGEIDWPSFVRPLCTGVWPADTVLPATWQYGDPIPGGLGEAQEQEGSKRSATEQAM